MTSGASAAKELGFRGRKTAKRGVVLEADAVVTPEVDPEPEDDDSDDEEFDTPLVTPELPEILPSPKKPEDAFIDAGPAEPGPVKTERKESGQASAPVALPKKSEIEVDKPAKRRYRRQKVKEAGPPARSRASSGHALCGSRWRHG